MAELGVDVYYVLTGKAGPCSEEDSELLSYYQRCSSDSQRSIRELAAKEAEIADELEKETKKRMAALYAPQPDDDMSAYSDET